MTTKEIITLVKDKLGKDISEQEARDYLEGKTPLPDEALEIVGGGASCSQKCPGCGASLAHFKGTTHLECNVCGYSGKSESNNIGARNLPSVPAIFCDEYPELLKRYKEDGNPFQFNLIEGVVKGYKKGGFAFWENDKEDPFNQQRVSCDMCRNRPYILPDSTLVPCIGWVSTPIEGSLPKLKETSLSAIYADPASYFRKLVGIKVSDITEYNAECKQCEYKLTCGGGCRADALATNNCSDAIYKRGMMMCEIYRSGFMKKLQEICRSGSAGD